MRNSQLSTEKRGRPAKPLASGSTFLAAGLTYAQLRARAHEVYTQMWEPTSTSSILTSGRGRLFAFDTEETLAVLRHLCNKFKFRNQSLYLTHSIDQDGKDLDVELYLDAVEQMKSYHSRLFWLKAFVFFSLLRHCEPISFGGLQIFVDIDGRVTPLGERVSWSKVNQNTDHFFVGIDSLYQSRLSIACLGVINHLADKIESAFDRTVFVPSFKDLANSIRNSEEIEDYSLSLFHLSLPLQLKTFGQLGMALTTAVESIELPNSAVLSDLISDGFYRAMDDPETKKPLLFTVA